MLNTYNENNSSYLRDELFWKDLQKTCTEYQKNISDELIPILEKMGLINCEGKALRVNMNNNNPMLSIYPLIEALIFPSAVFCAALHEYITNFTKEDELNLKKYLFSCTDDIIENSDSFGSNSKQILKDRLYEYSIACKNELPSGLSLYGQFGMDFDSLKDWSSNHQVKCAHIMCDYIAYIKHFGKFASFSDLEKLKPIVINNTEEDLKEFIQLFDKLHVNAGAIYITVEEALDNNLRTKHKSNGLCQHCGGQFKGLFKKVCSQCGKPKDY